MPNQFLTKVVITIGIVALLLIHPPRVEAQVSCDACTAAAVLLAGTTISGTIASLEYLLAVELYNIGSAVGSLVSATTVGFSGVTNAVNESTKNIINEEHLLAGKVETLRLKQNITDSFGSLSTVNCFETEKSNGLLSSNTDTADRYETAIRDFNSEIRGGAKTVSVRQRIMHELWPEGVDVASFTSGDKTLSEEDMLLAPMLVQILSQKTIFPNVGTRNNAAPNQKYVQLKREHDTHINIVQDQLEKGLLRNANTLDAGEYVSEMLEAAGIDPVDFVKDGKTSENAVVKAVGVSNFGSAASAEVSDIFGEELLRKLILDVGKSNYISSKEYALLSDIRLMETINLAKRVEEFYEPKMEAALNNLN